MEIPWNRSDRRDEHPDSGSSDTLSGYWGEDKDKVLITAFRQTGCPPQVAKCWSKGMRAKWTPFFHPSLPNTQHSWVWESLQHQANLEWHLIYILWFLPTNLEGP